LQTTITILRAKIIEFFKSLGDYTGNSVVETPS